MAQVHRIERAGVAEGPLAQGVPVTAVDPGRAVEVHRFVAASTGAPLDAILGLTHPVERLHLLPLREALPWQVDVPLVLGGTTPLPLFHPMRSWYASGGS